MKTKAVAFVSLNLLAASAAVATQGMTSDTINVIGRKPAEVREEAKEFVRKVVVYNRPVSRFIDPVCPKVLGIGEELAKRIETRIRTIAREVGARVAGKRCDANLTIAFTGASDAVIEEVTTRTPGLFEEGGPGTLERLKRSPAPIRWWHIVEERTKDGLRTMGNDLPPATIRAEQPGNVPMGGRVYQQYRPSFLSSQMIRALTSASIIVDVNRATGLPLDSVGDFAALVGLAEVRFDDEAPPNSILNVYAKEGPKELTPLDTDFLRTLYRLPLDRTALAHRGLLIKGLVGGTEIRSSRR